MNWYRGQSTTRRPVDAGIKARTKRGRIGEQWWSRRFVDVLESYGVGGRLQRGRTYARAGQVIRLGLGPGVVSADVQGTRAEPYHVRIEVECLDNGQWRAVEDALAERALFRAKLLAGEMPRDIEDVFHDVGVPLFPEHLADFDLTCSCPDWGLPCKHQAAVLYLVAERFDDDPFQVLLWRGKHRDDLLDGLRSRTASSNDAVTAEVEDPPLEERLDRFWAPGASLAKLRSREAAPRSPADFVLKLHDPPALPLDLPLTGILATAYQQLADPDPTAPPR